MWYLIFCLCVISLTIMAFSCIYAAAKVSSTFLKGLTICIKNLKNIHIFWPRTSRNSQEITRKVHNQPRIGMFHIRGYYNFFQMGKIWRLSNMKFDDCSTSIGWNTRQTLKPWRWKIANDVRRCWKYQKTENKLSQYTVRRRWSQMFLAHMYIWLYIKI